MVRLAANSSHVRPPVPTSTLCEYAGEPRPLHLELCSNGMVVGLSTAFAALPDLHTLWRPLVEDLGLGEARALAGHAEHPGIMNFMVLLGSCAAKRIGHAAVWERFAHSALTLVVCSLAR